jgi:hypothetical protein
MKRYGWYSLFIISIISGSSGCVKQENYPDVPQIQFLSYTSVFDTGQYAVRGILTISFTDGNGDIGLNSRDTLPPYDTAGPYYYNYVINYFEKQQGAFKQIDLNPPFSVRIPVLNREFPGKPIKGIITDTLGLNNPHPLFDTIKFEAFIYDRTLNKSNVISTPEIILKRR